MSYDSGRRGRCQVISHRSVPPVIIIGMHRSGTTMIAEMLEQCGLFLGVKQDPNHEALFFRRLNDLLLHQCGATWDHPGPFKYLLGNKEVRDMTENHVRHVLQSFKMSGYLGWNRYVRYRSMKNLVMAWGWKDPRTTHTLPLWLDIFPDAKIIHIYRHGVDVANSLRVRQAAVLKKEKELYRKRKPLYGFIDKRGRFADSLRCLTLEGGFSLWEEYMQEAHRHVTDLGDRAMEVQYEKFISDAPGMIKILARFCDLRVDNGLLARIASQVRPGRAYAFITNPVLKEFAEQVSPQLRRNHY